MKILVPPMQGNGTCVASRALLASVDVRVAVNSFVVSWGKHLIYSYHAQGAKVCFSQSTPWLWPETCPTPLIGQEDQVCVCTYVRVVARLQKLSFLLECLQLVHVKWSLLKCTSFGVNSPECFPHSCSHAGCGEQSTPRVDSCRPDRYRKHTWPCVYVL